MMKMNELTKKELKEQLGIPAGMRTRRGQIPATDRQQRRVLARFYNKELRKEAREELRAKLQQS